MHVLVNIQPASITAIASVRARFLTLRMLLRMPLCFVFRRLLFREWENGHDLSAMARSCQHRQPYRVVVLLRTKISMFNGCVRI